MSLVIAPLVVWLGSTEWRGITGRVFGITGRVFGISGGQITVAEGWHASPRIEHEGRWDPAELGERPPAISGRPARPG